MSAIVEDNENFDSDEEEPKVDTNAESDAQTTEPDRLAAPKYEIRPNLKERFQSLAIRDIILTTMRENLYGEKYSDKNAETWVKTIASVIREKVVNLNMKRYKVMVQVFVGENNGPGVKSVCRCQWDSECDDYVSDHFVTDDLFCCTTVFGVYFY